MNKRCPSCLVEFDCHTDGTCWCADIALSFEQLKRLRERFDQCLCPQCLVREGTRTKKSASLITMKEDPHTNMRQERKGR